MTRSGLDRRRFLQALGVGAALPFVPRLEAHAAASASKTPRRLLFFFNSNGTIRESWLPKMTGGALELSPILKPLEPFQSKLLVVDGLAHKVILEKSNRSGHSAGMNTALTGRTNKITDPSQPLHSLATGISVDQFVADKIGAGTKVRSLELGVQVEPYNVDYATLAYRGPLQPLSTENSPYLAFDRMFRGLPGKGGVAREADVAASREADADRQRVIESVSLELDALRGRLGQADRVKMEAHLAALRAIGHGLSTGVGSAASATCRAPEQGARLDLWKNENVPALARLQIDLLVMALACDLTRVGTIMFGRAGAGHRFTWLGPEFAVDPQIGPVCQAKGFHAVAHREADPTERAKLVRIHTWYGEQFAYLLGRLAAVPEGGGTLLDHTLVVWVNELGTGADHSHEKTPWVLAGGAGVGLKTGQLVEFPGEPHNRILMTICHAMGVEVDAFGDPDYCKAGALTGVTT